MGEYRKLPHSVLFFVKSRYAIQLKDIRNIAVRAFPRCTLSIIPPERCTGETGQILKTATSFRTMPDMARILSCARVSEQARKP